MHSIRTKITLMTALALVATMAVATIFGVTAIREMGNDSARETLYLLCETGERNLDSYFGSVEQSVEMVAAFVETDLDGLDDEHLQAHLDRVSTMFERLMFKTNGVLTYYYRIDPAVSATTKGFWFVSQPDGSFQPHEVTDISQYDTTDTTQLPWFTVPKETGESVWEGPYITENLGARVISYNTPIYYKGQFVGVIGIEVDFSTISDQVNNMTLYQSGYAFINDAAGRVVYHPLMDETTMDETTFVPDGLLGSDNLVHYTYEGVDKVAVWLPLENGMRLNVSVPVDEINARSKAWATALTLTFLAMLVFFVVIIMAFTGRITKPLRDLATAAEQVNQGNYDCALDYDSKDEVGVLTRTFNLLVAHLKAQIDDLSNRAYTDTLTSLRNKAAFDRFMESLEADASNPNSDETFAVCVFDCNSLKEVNDQFGHDKGDIYLQDTSRVICDIFDHSPVFRIGGDEFVTVLQGRDYANRDDLIAEFDAVCAKLRETEQDRWKQVDAARGIAVYDPQEDETVNDVVRRADRLMYENKWLIKEARGEA